MNALAEDQSSWIQNSLERLESLEAYREQLAAAGPSDQLAEVDEEIQSLYEVLEAAAESDDEPASSPLAMAPPVESPFDEELPTTASSSFESARTVPPASASASAFGATPFAPSPFDAAPIAPSPFDAAPPAQGFGGHAPNMAAPMDMASDYSDIDDGDIKSPRSSLPLLLLGLLLLGGGGVGAYMFLNKSVEKAPQPEYTGPATIIKAAEVPEDTQEPRVAQGADADRTPSANLDEVAGSKSASKSSNRSRSKRRSRSKQSKRSNRKQKDNDRKVNFDKSGDPLAGVR